MSSSSSTLSKQSCRNHVKQNAKHIITFVNLSAVKYMILQCEQKYRNKTNINAIHQINMTHDS